MTRRTRLARGGIGSNQYGTRGVSRAAEREARGRARRFSMRAPIEPVEPDEVDYTHAAEGALTSVGFDKGRFDHSQLYWATDGREQDRLGINGRILIDEIEADYLSEEMAAELQAVRAVPFAGDIELRYTTWARGNGGLTDERAQFISVDLDDETRQVVADHLRANGEMFTEDMVRYWANNDPAGMQTCFDFVSLRQEWDKVGAAVEACLSDGDDAGPGQALRLARALRAEAARTYSDECDNYIGSDQWQADRAEAV